MKKLLVVILIMIVLLSRSLVLFTNDDYLTPEPAIDYLTTKELVVDHIVPLSGYALGGYVSPSKIGWNLLLAIPFFLSSGHPFSLKTFMFFVSVATVFVAFSSMRKFYDGKTAIAISFFLAVSPILIEYASEITPPFAVPLITAGMLFFLFNVFKKKYTFLYPLAFSVGLVAHFELAIAGVLFLQLLLIASFFLWKKSLSLQKILIAFVIFSLTVFPVVVYDLFQLLVKTKQLTTLVPPQKMSFVSLFVQHGETFVWNFRSVFIQQPIIAFVFAALLIFGSYIFLKDKHVKAFKKNVVLYLVTSPLAFFVLFLLFPGVIYGWWLSLLVVYYCFLAGILAAHFFSKKQTKYAVIAIVIILFFFFIRRTLHATTMFSFPPSIDQIKVVEPIEYIYKDAKGNNFSYEVLSYHKPAGRAYDYEAMFWWIGKKLKATSDITKNAKLHYYLVDSNYKEKLPRSPMRHIKTFPNGIKIYRKTVN